MSDMATKGTYQYVDGTPFVFSDFTYDAYNWHTANVDEARGKCVSMNVTNSGWQYSDCNTPLPFICKLKPHGKVVVVIIIVVTFTVAVAVFVVVAAHVLFFMYFFCFAHCFNQGRIVSWPISITLCTSLERKLLK